MAGGEGVMIEGSNVPAERVSRGNITSPFKEEQSISEMPVSELRMN